MVSTIKTRCAASERCQISVAPSFLRSSCQQNQHAATLKFSFAVTHRKNITMEDMEEVKQVAQ